VTEITTKDALQLALDAEARNGEMATRIVGLCDRIAKLETALAEARAFVDCFDDGRYPWLGAKKQATLQLIRDA
jgi:hypothetical protein